MHLDNVQLEKLLDHHIEDFLLNTKASKGKLDLINFLNTPYLGFGVSVTDNPFYQPEKVEKFIEKFLADLQSDDPAYPEATLTILQEVSVFNSNNFGRIYSPSENSRPQPVAFTHRLAKRLAEIGSPGHKMLHINHFAGLLSTVAYIWRPRILGIC